MFKLLTILATLFFAAFAVVEGSPVKRAKLDVWNPRITSPTAGDIWSVSSTRTVEWDISEIPPKFWNTTGALYLGFWEPGSDSENLDITHPLAKGFKYSDLQVSVTVPDVPTRDTYIVVLTGDSGNVSQNFTITNEA